MSEKTAWVELQVTMSQELRATIHACHRVLGSTASGWARDILLNHVPALVRRAEEREAAIQCLAGTKKAVAGAAKATKAKPASKRHA